MNTFFWVVGTALVVFVIMEHVSKIKVDKIEIKTHAQIFRLATVLGFNGDPLNDQAELIRFLEQNGFHNPTERDGTPHFKVNDPDLDLLMNLGGDMLVGPANMDTAIWFMQALDKVLDRLRPHEAPFHDGLSTIIKEPDSNVS